MKLSKIHPMAGRIWPHCVGIVLAALMYLVLLWPLVRLLSRLEHKSISMH